MTINEALNILGLSSGCSNDELKKAYRLLVKKYHPDIVGRENNEFIKINKAYDFLIEKGTFDGCKLTHASIFNIKRT